MTEKEAIKYLKDGWVGSCYQSAKLMGIAALEKQEKIKKDLKYYLDTNEENGVVYIPKFVIEKIVNGT